MIFPYRKQIQEVNLSRKSVQMQVGEKLKELETKWVTLVSKNYEIEQACAQLQKEISDSKIMKQRGGN